MNKATPVQMRRCLELTMAMRNAGIEFVPIPVIGDVDRVRLQAILADRMARIEKDCAINEGAKS